ncbi:WD40-repeat-containing domain protein [Daedaleopsis nitida]|nr:WD40-repeat-containing domain protein [Daedaleopsis nitida]
MPCRSSQPLLSVHNGRSYLFGQFAAAHARWSKHGSSQCSPELKSEGTDWFAIYNAAQPGPGDDPIVKKRSLDVKLVVCCVRFSADGKYFATGCKQTAQVYDTNTGTKTCVLVDEAASDDLYIRILCFSPDGKYLATGATDKQIRVIWDIDKKQIQNVFEGHEQDIYSLDFLRDGQLIVSGSGDHTIRIWDMAGDAPCKVCESRLRLPSPVKGHTHPLAVNILEPDSVNAGVPSVCISPDRRLVAADSLDTIVRIWDVQCGQLVDRLKGHGDSVCSVAFTPDGKGLVSGSLDNTLKYWDIRPLLSARDPDAAHLNSNGAAQACTMTFRGPKEPVFFSVAVSHDGKWVVSGSKDCGVQFWDVNTAVAQCMLQGHKSSVISIDLSRAGNVLATGSGDRQARICTLTFCYRTPWATCAVLLRSFVWQGATRRCDARMFVDGRVVCHICATHQTLSLSPHCHPLNRGLTRLWRLSHTHFHSALSPLRHGRACLCLYLKC